MAMKRTIYLYKNPNTPRPPTNHPTSQKRPNITGDYYFAINKKTKGDFTKFQNHKRPSAGTNSIDSLNQKSLDIRRPNSYSRPH